jgi:hypothetical protein
MWRCLIEKKPEVKNLVRQSLYARFELDGVLERRKVLKESHKCILYSSAMSPWRKWPRQRKENEKIHLNESKGRHPDCSA